MMRDFGMVIPTNDLYRGSEFLLERFQWEVEPMQKQNALPDAQNYQAFDSSPVRDEIMANNKEDERLYDYVVRSAQLPSEAGSKSTSDAGKWKADSDFEEYRKSHPGADYSQFYTSRAVALVRSGREHNSLGNNIVTSGIKDFWETGARQVKRLMQLGNVQPSHRVVEYGCGSLRMAGHFLKLLEPGNFFGLDVVSDFYELGVANVGAELIEKARPRFEVISEESVAAAAAFQPDFVFAHSVVIHVHPDILPKMFDNMARIASKPGAVVAFNALLHEPEVRYANLGWARPESYIKEHFRDFELVKIDRGKPSDRGGYQVTGAMFVFRRVR
jgi:SAM-dependent methyltransferase